MKCLRRSSTKSSRMRRVQGRIRKWRASDVRWQVAGGRPTRTCVTCRLIQCAIISGASSPTPRMTSHSVCPSATVPLLTGGGLPAAPSSNAFASAVPGGGAMPGHAPSALTRSSAVTGLSGVNGGVSIDTLRMNTRPVRENQSASRDRKPSGASRRNARADDACAGCAQYGHRVPPQ